MKKLMTRLLTGVLTLATVFTALPVTQVQAADSVYTHSDGKTGTVVKVTDGGEEASTFEEGWMKADGETAYCIQLAIYMCVFIGAKFMQSSFAIDFDIGSLSFYIQLILKSVVIVSMSFIALFVGMAMKSSKATIITSFLLIFLTQANVGDFTLANNAIFPIVLTIISLGFAVLSVYNAESKDLL
ncbi:hypothetical protein [Dorea amylophila]|uniref:hypothetical protein n=1 Tax=Dorea amylophila TaxID=2981789 RepID=UPI0032661395